MSTSGRRAYSCQPCRAKKIKCDRRRFCGNCRRKDVDCIWPPNGSPLPDNNEDNSVVRHVSANATPAAQSRLSEISPTQWQFSPSIPIDPTLSRHPPEVDIPQTVVLAEQFDHSILNDVDEDDDVVRATEIALDARRHQEGGAGKEVKRAFPFIRGGKAGVERGFVSAGLLKALPERNLADFLLRIYLERVEWIHHPLHLPSFLAQYNKFWGMSDSKRCDTVRAVWLSLLYIILCLGAHFSDKYQPSTEESLLTACEDCLSAGDFLNESSMEAIQAIICLNLYLNNMGRTSAAKSMQGLAIKIAISQGLSRIPPETSGEVKPGVLEREMGRRLWWSLVCQDAYTASTSGFTYVINPAHSFTTYFQNINDEDIIEDRHLPLNNSMNHTTISTFHLCKIRFAMVVRDFVDKVNAHWPNPPYSVILELENQFRTAYSSLPEALRPDKDQPFSLVPQLAIQRAFMGVTLHNRLMRLHRAYMLNGYTDPNYRQSTETCLNSACALLDLINGERGLCRWWVVVVHIWTAGLIVCADLNKVDGLGDRGKMFEKAGLAMTLMEHCATPSPVAARGRKVLLALVDQSRQRDISNTLDGVLGAHLAENKESNEELETQNPDLNNLLVYLASASGPTGTEVVEGNPMPMVANESNGDSADHTTFLDSIFGIDLTDLTDWVPPDLGSSIISQS